MLYFWKWLKLKKLTWIPRNYHKIASPSMGNQLKREGKSMPTHHKYTSNSNHRKVKVSSIAPPILHPSPLQWSFGGTHLTVIFLHIRFHAIKRARKELSLAPHSKIQIQGLNRRATITNTGKTLKASWYLLTSKAVFFSSIILQSKSSYMRT